ncbi:MAG: SPOR domain-containing protein [Ignavibacteria bacterium]|nr:SPOR domain-containing protein [Ignavibacteria bacterium]
MKIIIAYCFLVLMFPLFFLFSSCSGSDDDDIYLIKDTVIKNVDSLITEKREVKVVNLVFVIQLAAFRDIGLAEKFAMNAKGDLNTIPDILKKGDVYLVTAGKFNDAKSAQEYLSYVKSHGYPKAFIKSLN